MCHHCPQVVVEPDRAVIMDGVLLLTLLQLFTEGKPLLFLYNEYSPGINGVASLALMYTFTYSYKGVQKYLVCRLIFFIHSK